MQSRFQTFQLPMPKILKYYFNINGNICFFSYLGQKYDHKFTIKYNTNHKIWLIVLKSPLPSSAQYFPHQLWKANCFHFTLPSEKLNSNLQNCFLISVPGAVSRCMSSYYRCCLLCLHTLPLDLGATCSLLVFAVSSSKDPLLPATQSNKACNIL